MESRRRIYCAALAGLGLVFAAPLAKGAIIAQWTYETSQPTTAGPVSPEVGTGSAVGSHAGAAVYSTPAGNGSAHSHSSTIWAVNDYWQYQTSTTGQSGIVVEWDQTSSNTGPRDFTLQYSTDGTTFSIFGSTYAVQANASPNPTWNAATSSPIYHFTQDLSSITALNNQATVYFRLVDASTVSANGGTVASAGTDRVDNFTVETGPVPEPATAGIVVLGSVFGLLRRSRRD
jgi:hypothetical protein